MADEDEQATLQDGELSLDDNANLDVDMPSEEADQHSSDTSDDASTKRVKDAQRAFHEEAQKRAELERQIEKMGGQLSVLTELVGSNGRANQQPVQEANPFAFLDDEKFKESVLDSSENLINGMKRIVSEFGRTLHLRDQMWGQELNQRDPEIRSLSQRINEFRQENPDLQELSDVQIAKVLKKVGYSQESEPKKKVLSIGNRPVSKSPEDEQLKKDADMWYNRIGYGVYKDLENRRKKK